VSFQARIEALRLHDPGKGSFTPVSREPKVDRETNPRGVRRPFKTRQDAMPVSERPRVQAAKDGLKERQKHDRLLHAANRFLREVA